MQIWPPDFCPRTSSDCKDRNDIKIPWVHSDFQFCLLTGRMLRLGCSSKLGHLPLGVNTCLVSAPIVRNRCWVNTVSRVTEVDWACSWRVPGDSWFILYPPWKSRLSCHLRCPPSLHSHLQKGPTFWKPCAMPAKPLALAHSSAISAAPDVSSCDIQPDLCSRCDKLTVSPEHISIHSWAG